jgi:hypothetical protein
MRNLDWRALVGAVLVIVGVLLLLQTFDVLRLVVDVVWTLVFLAAGAGFLVVYLGDGRQWWAVIPGMALLGIAATIGLSVVGLADELGGAAFLGAVSLAFWLVYLRNTEHWWAIIPAGVLLTLAGVAAMEGLAPRAATGGPFFLGLAATFVLVYLLPSGGERMTWALIPAAVLFAVGVLVFLATSSLFRYVLPAAAVVGGGYLVFRALRQGEAGEQGETDG